MGKPSYTISELAKDFSVTTRTIRFYEEKGLIQSIGHTNGLLIEDFLTDTDN